MSDKLMQPISAPEASPCKQVCRLLQPHATLCSGCGRSKEEIARWASMSDNERRMVKRRAAKRMLEVVS